MYGTKPESSPDLVVRRRLRLRLRLTVTLRPGARVRARVHP